jgi:tRNA(Arg) A34 adenosine deaminase TadA/predicted enzyme related to lactoylglutathione lyase
MTDYGVEQLRVVLVTEDFDAAVRYYRDVLGLAEEMAVAGPDGAQVVILEAGRATLELGNPAHGRYIAAVETGGAAGPPIRLAFQVGDVAAAVAASTDAGVPVVAAPVQTPWYSRNARLDGPAGLPVTLFQELRAPEPVGAAVDDLGGEPGLLAHTVRLAVQRAALGEAPFAAIVVRDGTVLGTGVNTVLADHDPAAHAEVTAIRDAAQRAGTADLSGATVYSSCEPCAICRTVAVTAGVREIVYAAGRTAVPPEIDPDPAAGARVMDALALLQPGLVRRGATGLPADALEEPFRTYLAALAR